MQLDRRDLLRGTAALTLSAGAAGAATPGGNPTDAQLTPILDDLAERYLIRQPEQATSFGLDVGPREGLKSQLADASADYLESDRYYCAEGLRRLGQVDAFPLSPEGLLNRAAVSAALHLGLGGAAFPFGDNSLSSTMNEASTPYVVNQQAGAYASVPEFLASQHRIESRDDADAYLSRVYGMARALSQETWRIRRDAARGVIAPDFILDSTIGQQEAMLAVPAAQARLTRTLALRADALKLDGNFAARAERLVERLVYPALASQLEALREVRAGAGSEATVARLPDGEAYYGWLMKVGASTTLSADEVHRTGLEQTAEIETRMDAILKAQGLTQGTVGARMTAMGSNPKYLFADTEKGRAQLIAYLNGRIAAVRPRLSRAFTLKLKAPIDVRRVPADIQDGASQGYMNFGALDGSRPAIYYVNLKTTLNWPRFSLPSLTYHEGVPGHAWQGAYVTETGELPLIRVLLGGFNGYVEGYGLYAEQLADELGLYDEDWAGRLGYLQAERFRAMRLVLDTGLHARRWSRDRAIRWAVETSGRTVDAMSSEVDRYTVIPGQALGYKIGQNEINRLRDRAKAAAGETFDVRRFNDLLLTTGAVPLDLLADIVDRRFPAQTA